MSKLDGDMISASTQIITADMDSEGSDDEIFNGKDELIDRSPFPDHCHNIILGIESFYRCFERRYEACPVFSMSSLSEALQVAFNPTSIDQKRCPVLVYIHNDKTMFSNIFCKTIFCHHKIIDYLLYNYIVWPWDVTLESNKNTLTGIWEELFGSTFFDEFSIDDCPLLIGITRRFEYKTEELVITDYQYKTLLRGDTLTRPRMVVSCETLKNELDIFKNLYNEHELSMLFNFHKTVGLPWEIILQIVKYLSLNDTISAFSTDILPLLNNSHLNFQLSNPSISFTKIILQNFQVKQIVSLELNANQKWSERHIRIFQNVVSLTLLNQLYTDAISYFEAYLPNLTCLSFCYDNEIDLDAFNKILNQFWYQIKRLEIHCAGIVCPHYRENFLNKWTIKTSAVEYFLFDVRYFPLISPSNCFDHHTSCFLESTIDFIQKMMFIRHVHLVINKVAVEQLLSLTQWTILFNKCLHLKKITIEVLGNTLENERFEAKAIYFQNQLRTIRETIKFQIKFL